MFYFFALCMCSIYFSSHLARLFVVGKFFLKKWERKHEHSEEEKNHQDNSDNDSGLNAINNAAGKWKNVQVDTERRALSSSLFILTQKLDGNSVRGELFCLLGFFSRTTRADRRRCAILTATWSGNEVIMPGSLHAMKCSDRVAVLSSPGGVIFYTHPNWLICWGISGERERERYGIFRRRSLLAWLFSSRIFFSFS